MRLLEMIVAWDWREDLFSLSVSLMMVSLDWGSIP